jgi:hypothetical protein
MTPMSWHDDVEIHIDEPVKVQSLDVVLMTPVPDVMHTIIKPVTLAEWVISTVVSQILSY